MKIKVGIFFGGPSREREISFAGGRTVYDNLDKRLFEAVPIFVDSFRNFILLDWHHIYKGSIRDFFPASPPPSAHGFQVYQDSLGPVDTQDLNSQWAAVGSIIPKESLGEHIQLAFLALHGEYGEDGVLQGELNALGIPYTGSGVEASALGMNKAKQKQLMQEKGFDQPKIATLERDQWLDDLPPSIKEVRQSVGKHIVVRPANQGSSIGVSILPPDATDPDFQQAVDRAFFIQRIDAKDWHARSSDDKTELLREINDIRSGIGFPLDVAVSTQRQTVYHPDALLKVLDDIPVSAGSVRLEGHHSETEVVIETFIDGREFSCIVLRSEDGSILALPPTEIVKGGEVFDYRSKYMPGLSRKETPIDLPAEDINAIRRSCEKLYTALGFQVYARIDGFFTADKKIFLNDPNTTSGMLPSSFFFHQAAEIGLSPSQFLTYITRTSLAARLEEQPDNLAWQNLLSKLDTAISAQQEGQDKRKKVAVILGGYSAERHISVESGRNIFEKLASSTKYQPVPVFLSGSTDNMRFHELPVNLLLKDHADDIRDKVQHFKAHPILVDIRNECRAITAKYAGSNTRFEPRAIKLEDLTKAVDFVFLALHGRPGEDGQLQIQLDALGIPYNGSGIKSSATTINKYNTLQTLSRNGLPTTTQLLKKEADFLADPVAFYEQIEVELNYPLIAKPVDDGCSAAVQKIDNRAELVAYTDLLFGRGVLQSHRDLLGIDPKEEIPRKSEILFEALIDARDATHFLEITGGLLTYYDDNGMIQYQMLEPSEALAQAGILSVEEKFLAGEGQNLTPARFSSNPAVQAAVSEQVKGTLERAARILQVEGYARIDAFVRIFPDARAETIIVEVNSLPGMTPATAIFHQAALADYQPYQFINHIIEFGEARLAAKKQPVAAASTTATAHQATVGHFSSGDSRPAQETYKAMDNPQPETEAAPATARTFNQKLAHFGKFFISGIFWRNILAIAVGAFFFIWMSNMTLGCMTRHGQEYQVNNYVGMQIEDAAKAARRDGFRTEVIDSIFVLDRSPGEVYLQQPAPGSMVKKNRKLYLTIFKRQPPEVLLPLLVGNYNYDQYSKKLRSLKVRDTIIERTFDNVLEANTIKHLYYDGKKITDADLRNGVKVPQGTQLQLVVSKRTSDNVRLPDLRCMRYEEATFLLSNSNLKVGEVVGQVGDRSSAYIYKQEPPFEPGRVARVGSSVTLYLQSGRPDGCD